MGDVVDFRRSGSNTTERDGRKGPRPGPTSRHDLGGTGMRSSPPSDLLESIRKGEVAMGLASFCRNVQTGLDDMIVEIESTPRGQPLEHRTWSATIVDRAGRRHVMHGPVGYDRIDEFAGVVRAAMTRWIEVVRRRGAMGPVRDRPPGSPD